jgi:glycosyltransferase involved in cell wall biosynthesis
VVGNTGAKAILEAHRFPRAVTVLPQLGVDPSSFHPAAGIQQTGTVIGYVGRLVQQKGLFVLLRAVALLPSNVRLMVVGNGPLTGGLLERARTLGLDGRLDLHQGVAHNEVPSYLRQMSVLVLPSLTTLTWKEQFGHVLIEAMASGVPVVGSDSGAIPEVIGDAGIVVQEGNPEALAAALERLMSNPPLHADLAARGRARVLAQYTDEAIARRLATFWEVVTSGAHCGNCASSKR